MLSILEEGRMHRGAAHCPVCFVPLSSDPMKNDVRADRILQNIVNKLLPIIQENQSEASVVQKPQDQDIGMIDRNEDVRDEETKMDVAPEAAASASASASADNIGDGLPESDSGMEMNGESVRIDQPMLRNRTTMQSFGTESGEEKIAGSVSNLDVSEPSPDGIRNESQSAALFKENKSELPGSVQVPQRALFPEKNVCSAESLHVTKQEAQESNDSDKVQNVPQEDIGANRNKGKQITFELIPYDDSGLPSLDKAFIETSNKVSIRHVKKFLITKLNLDASLRHLHKVSLLLTAECSSQLAGDLLQR